MKLFEKSLTGLNKFNIFVAKKQDIDAKLM